MIPLSVGHTSNNIEPFIKVGTLMFLIYDESDTEKIRWRMPVSEYMSE